MKITKALYTVVSLLNAKEKAQGVRVLCVMGGMSLLEVIGVVSVLPFLTLISNPDVLEKNEYLAEVYQLSHYIGITDKYMFLASLGAASFLVILFVALYRAYANYAINYFIELRRDALSSRLFGWYLSRDFDFYLVKDISDIKKTVLSEVDQLVSQVLRPVVLMISHAFISLALVFLLFFFDPVLALSIFGVFGAFYLLVYMAFRKILERNGEERVLSNTMRFKVVSEAFLVIKDLKFFKAESKYYDDYRAPSRSFSTAQAKHMAMSQTPQYLIEAVAFGGIVLFASVLILQGEGDRQVFAEFLPVLGLYAFVAYRMQPSLRSIFQGVAALKYGAVLLTNFSREFGAKAAVFDPQPEGRLKFEKDITLKGIEYAYPGAERQVLDGVSLSIRKGESVAIVGGSGAGKTTLVDVLLGLLVPTGGNIFVDSNLMSSFDYARFRSLIGYVSQQVTLVDKAVSENIAFGQPKNKVDMARVIAVAKMAQLHGVITNKLQDGYDTVLGENGFRLSGGERQRLGIARALYRDPEVLILDEATSALDTVTESEVSDAIYSMARKKTMIIIAHRLSTVKKCDRIVVMEKGMVKAVGSYQELSEIDSTFKKMLNAS